jgi:peptidoglycan/xylan/chitin deacetylase (PgdA/CDA1 family)
VSEVHLSRTARLLVTGVALASLAATTALFIRETRPFSASRPAAVHAHLTASDVRALATPISYADAIPVLNFHDVSTRPGVYSVTPAMFANQMAALRRAGFQTVSLEQVRDLVLGQRPVLPTRPVLITFDDGVASEYTRADPILAANHFRAVSFVVASRLGDGRKPSYYLSWPQLRAMSRSGRWEFAARTDAAGRDVTTALTANELARSGADLRRGTGTAPYAVSLPFSASALPTTKPAAMARIRQALASSFSLAFVSDLRSPYAVDANSDPLLLPRFEVTAHVDVPGLFSVLRQMVPSPPGRGVASWALAGPACTITGDAVTITAPSYALCRSQLNGGRWTDYRLTMKAAGLTGKTTLVVLCRTGTVGDVELSVGSRLVVLRALVDDHYSTLGTWPTPAPGPGGTHTISIDVVRTTASVVVDGATVGTARFGRTLAAGAPGLGIAGGGTVTVTGASATDLRPTAATP